MKILVNFKNKKENSIDSFTILMLLTYGRPILVETQFEEAMLKANEVSEIASRTFTTFLGKFIENHDVGMFWIPGEGGMRV